MSWPFMDLVKEDLLPVQVIRGGSVTIPFGQPGSWAMGIHPGDDWNGPSPDLGKPVRSSCTGVVLSGDWGADYGIHVIVGRDDGRRVAFCHLSAKNVRAGDEVKAGDVLGWVGMTGRTTGPHCHVEERVRPWRYNRGSVRKPTYERIPGG